MLCCCVICFFVLFVFFFILLLLFDQFLNLTQSLSSTLNNKTPCISAQPWISQSTSYAAALRLDTGTQAFHPMRSGFALEGEAPTECSKAKPYGVPEKKRLGRAGVAAEGLPAAVGVRAEGQGHSPRSRAVRAE